MQTSLRRKHRDRVVRRGLALIIESEYARATLSHAPTTASAHAPSLPAAPQFLRHRRRPRALRRPAYVNSILVGPRPCLATPPLGHAHSRPSRVCRAASRRPATSTCSTRALPRLKPAQPGCWNDGSRLTIALRVRRYLTAANYDFSYDRSKNLRPKRNIRTAMNHEIMLYGGRPPPCHRPASRPVAQARAPHRAPPPTTQASRRRSSSALTSCSAIEPQPSSLAFATAACSPPPLLQCSESGRGVQVSNVALRRHVRCCHQTP